MAIQVFDFFSGCGGTSCGFEQAGMKIVLGLDFDHDSANTFQANFPRASFIREDIRALSTDVLAPFMKNRRHPVLFSGCAPCQPFSKQNKHTDESDDRRYLLDEFARFVKAWRPEYVFVENVPGMQKIAQEKSGPLPSFLRLLKRLGYKFSFGVIPAMSYGVPQKRDRFVLLASLDEKIHLPTATHGPDLKPYTTVRTWIDGLPPLQAGEVSEEDPDHAAASLSELNLLRIRSTPEGGGRHDWPQELWLDCHKTHSGHSDVYGRLAWDRPAAGLTTKCISYSNGRFGHPVEDRALSIREAACLQTFPRDYVFRGQLKSRARQVGNAVPPLMAKRVGKQIISHYKKLVQVRAL
ncbi:DNA cytosine methyltransferase [Herbaspirillum seropedicae]|uniref:DNA cytosine methyltransferase n=1 Tax=Herbaspirillum seropedicae TaxID=964 RepID=UPI003F8D3369